MDQTPSVKICLEVTNVSARPATVEIPLVGVKNATVKIAGANHPTFKSTASVNWPAAVQMPIANQTRPNV